MKNTFIKTDQVKKNILPEKKDIPLAVGFFILALLLFAALSTMAQTAETTAAPPAETFNVIRHGKEVTLTKDRWMTIVDFSIVPDSSAVCLKWRTKNSYGKGVCAVMRSEDGINYSYVSLLPAVKGENSFVVQNDCGNNPSYYRVLYINERNTFFLSEEKNTSGVEKENTAQQPCPNLLYAPLVLISLSRN